MPKPIDETMSEEQAFSEEELKDTTFQFDEEDEGTNGKPESAEDDTDSATPEDNKTVEDDSDDDSDQKVPYSRFKKVIDERDSYESTIKTLEERLTQLEQKPKEEVKLEDIQLPKEWVELYGDSDTAKKAFLVQVKREEEIEERAILKAIERLEKKQEENLQRLSENEEIIDDNLSSLSEQIGKKLTTKQEEEILAIVDEFSPVGEDGKYLSLFPFEKAYEIYTLRNGVKTQKVQRARTVVADLSGNQSESGNDESPTPFKRGWDTWREAL